MNRVTKQNIYSKELKELFTLYLKSSLHIRNMLVILINKHYETYKEEGCEVSKTIALYLRKPMLVRSLLGAQVGGKNKDKIDFLKRELEGDPIFGELLELGSSVHYKIIYCIVRSLSANYKSAFTKLKKASDEKVGMPRARSLRDIDRGFSIPIDRDIIRFKDGAVSFPLRKAEKRTSIKINTKQLLKVAGSFENVKEISLGIRHDQIFLSFNYISDLKHFQSKMLKTAAIDFGVCNIASIFIDDESSDSYVIDGSAFSSKNADFNRRLAKYQSEMDSFKNEARAKVLKEEKKGAELDCPKYIEARRLYRKNHLDRLDFFHSNFHKLSRRMLESLVKFGVDRLVLAKNLCFAKNTNTRTMGKKNNQRFYQLPIGKLIHYLEVKAPEYGIHIEFIDEAYTSKCSVLNGDSFKAQETKESTTEVLSGRRVCRSLFKDNKSAVIYHADVGAAANHIRVFYKGAKLAYLEKKLFKITKPIKIGKDATWSLLDRSRLIREKIFKALSGEFTLKIPPARSNLLFS